MCLIGAVEWFRGLLLTVAQILGAVAAAGVVKITFPGTYTIQTKLSHQTSVTQGLFIEMFLTAELMLAIYMLAVEKHGGNVTAPIIIGLAIFVTEYVFLQTVLDNILTLNQVAWNLLHRYISYPT